jgi:peptidyl-tRNA hydrolase
MSYSENNGQEKEVGTINHREDDPLVCYVVVRGSLNMSAGKACAQCCHAVQRLFLQYCAAMAVETKIHSETKEHAHIITMTTWMKNGSRKVVLEATDEQWLRLKDEYGKGAITIRDAGLTEVAEGTETAMALWPNNKSEFSSTIKQMRCL